MLTCKPIAGWLLLFTLLSHTLLFAATPSFPTLKGRIVDQAGILNPVTKSNLNALLLAHERATSNQLVIATVKNLEGMDIRQYGYQLGRHWKIGKADKNNGAILLVAPSAKKVAIEVGYGLEGQLTDVISHHIIQTVILPHFRQGDFNSGIFNGTQAMIKAIGGQYAPPPQRFTSTKRANNKWGVLLLFIIFGLQFFGGRRSRSFGLGSALLMGSALMGGRSGGFGGGASFGGGGGSFGGGGASGGW